MKKIMSVIVAAVLVVSSVALASAALELVRDGGFDSGLNEWTLLSGSGEIGGVCPEGAAHLHAADSSASYYQCVSLPAEAGNWTLSADLSATSGSIASVSSSFYSLADCTGDVTHSEMIDTADAASPNNFTYNVAGSAQSVQILLTASFVGEPQPVSACFDNVSLVANDAVAVTLTGMQAESKPPLPWSLLLAAGLGMIATAALLISRKKQL